MNGIGFTAPVGDSKKIDNVELIPRGLQLCTFTSLVDIGTQEGGKFGPKHRVRLVFEFPKHYRVFYEGDDAKPAAIFNTETMSMSGGSNLRDKWVEGMLGRKISDAEAEVFDISSLLGKHFVATIVHSDDGKWSNIAAIVPLDDQNKMMFSLTSLSVPQINPTTFFHFSQGFESKNFAELPNTVREKIIGSAEGQAHLHAGGKFAEAIERHSTAPSPPSGALVMIDQTVSYEAYKQAGWTDEQLIQNGKAKKQEVVAPPVPIVATPPPPVAAPPIPQAPVVPQAPVIQAPPVRKLVFNDPNEQPLEVWIKAGWTEEKIVAEGLATFQ